MVHSRLFLFTIVLALFSFSCLNNHCASEEVAVHGISETKDPPILVNVGVVLDLNSSLGSMAHFCIQMAISDFYKAHPDYTTRLHLHTKSAITLSDSTIAALELVKDEEVRAIFGPQIETANSFIAELGEKFHVPIISFTARSSRYNHYFISTTPDDVLQARALATMCKEFEWTEAAVLYEDMDHGNQFLSHLHKAFQEVEIGLSSTIPFHVSDNDMHLLKELRHLKEMRTRVFLVHMNPSLGYRFFTLAKGIGLMSEGCAWIITDSLSNFMNSLDSDTRNSMQGIVGLRPYVHISEELQTFRKRWKSIELNVYGLWAYDATTALAIAVENIEAINSTPVHAETEKSVADGTHLRTQTFAHQLLHELSRTKFRGLTGNFQLTDGKLERSTYEIFNLYGSGDKTMGFWTPGIGLTRELTSGGRETPPRLLKGLNIATWPGDSSTRPNGWSIPTQGKLRVGILLKKGFREFVDVTYDPTGNSITATGFAIDIFMATLRKMPTVDYEFRLYNGTNNSDWSYDDILHEIPKNFDMVVGATTIWAPRAEYVHFSLPYSESGAIMVVRNKKPVGMWTFIKPLSWDLWLAIVTVCLIIISVIWKMEHSRNGLLSSAAAAILAFIFADRTMVRNNWSRVVLLFGFFMAYIVKQIYNANLSAILANDQLEFAYSDKYFVGYQEGSFMKQFLIENLHISETRLRSYSSPEEYNNAMILGSKYGGIDVIFDEIPYMKILLKKYGSEYKMVLPTYSTGGFGFAFPIGSPLVTYFSKAILDVTQGSEMAAIEMKNFGAVYTSIFDPLSSTTSERTSSLILSGFSGLFIITICFPLLALFFSETNSGKNIIRSLKRYISGTNVTDTAPVQQSGTDPSHGQGDLGANTSAEAPTHSHGDDETKDAGTSGENASQEILETIGVTNSVVPQPS